MDDGVRPFSSEPSPLGKLRAGSVGLTGDVIASITNVGPTAGLGLSLAAFLVASGLASPATLLVAGAAGLCLALSFRRFNRWKPSSAAQVNWLRESVCPAAGFSGGIIYIIQGILVGTINMVLVGPVLVSLISPTESNGFLNWLVGGALTMGVCAVAAFGIKGSVRLQKALVYFEYTVVIGISVWLIVANATGHISDSVRLSGLWLVPLANPGGLTVLLTGLVVAQFGIGGWDAPTYLGEEQRNARVDPGRAMIIGIVFVTLYLMLAIFAFQGTAPTSKLIPQANILGYVASRVWGPGKYFITIALIFGLIAASQAVMNNSARVMHGMARRGAMPTALGRIKETVSTPWLGTWFMGIVPVILAGVYYLSTGAATALNDLVGTISYIQSTYYFGVVLAGVWFFRKEVTSSVKGFLLIAFFPLLGVIVMVYAFQRSFPTAGAPVIIPTLIIVFGSLLVGFILQAINRTGEFFDFSASRRDREGVRVEAIAGEPSAG